MNSISGNIRKLHTKADSPVHYQLPIGDTAVPLNPLLGQTIKLAFSGDIHCIACDRKTKKSFNQGYCYPCFRTLAACDMCIVRPETCHFDAGTCREPEWGTQHCMQPHYIYLANTSAAKVGITRETQRPTRWFDQGASYALSIYKVNSRYHSGLIETILKQHISDRTDWRRMLKGEPEPIDLSSKRDELLAACGDELETLEKQFGYPLKTIEEQQQSFSYPVLEYPSKVTALNFDKTPVVEGALMGIKGQYLIFDNGVINIRKFAGYDITVDC